MKDYNLDNGMPAHPRMEKKYRIDGNIYEILTKAVWHIKMVSTYNGTH